MAEMSDLEVVRLCAKATGYTLDEYEFGWRCRKDGNVHCIVEKVPRISGIQRYHPLTNKAQALDLVITLRLCIAWEEAQRWQVYRDTCFDPAATTADKDLLRAICLCAAKVQQAK